MKPLFLALPGNETAAKQLAATMGGELCNCEFRSFPDGETYLRLADNPQGRLVSVVCTLAQPDEKFLRLIFTANTLRELGAHRVGLVAPYLAYMRQDCRFLPGEAITSRVFAQLLSRSFDWLVTVDPHLHRYKSLTEIYPIPCRNIHAGPALASWISHNVEAPFIIGPDGESQQWVAAVASACGARYGILQKSRLADRSVAINAGYLFIPPTCTPVLVDDIVSSGATMLEALAAVRKQARFPAFVIAIHGLASSSQVHTFAKMHAHFVTTNTNPNPQARIDITPLLAAGLAEFLS